MKKKYEIKKTILPLNNHHQQTNISKYSLNICDKSENENKHEMFASIKDEKIVNNLLDSHCKFFKIRYILFIK
jgi:hypothetical protein